MLHGREKGKGSVPPAQVNTNLTTRQQSLIAVVVLSDIFSLIEIPILNLVRLFKI